MMPVIRTCIDSLRNPTPNLCSVNVFRAMWMCLLIYCADDVATVPYWGARGIAWPAYPAVASGNYIRLSGQSRHCLPRTWRNSKSARTWSPWEPKNLRVIGII